MFNFKGKSSTVREQTSTCLALVNCKIMAFSLARRWMSKMGGVRWDCGEGSHIAAVFVGIILSVLLVEHGEGIGAECTYLSSS